jgi:hypothetical protein
MGSIGVSVVAWVVAPALLYVLVLGVGLLVERLTGFRLTNALLAPVGACAAVLAGHAVYRVGAGVAVVAPLVVLAAVAGLVLARRDLRERLSPGLWPGLAALATYGLFIAPVVLAGGWTWTGYNFVNDTAVQFILTDHVAASGMSDPVGPPASEPFSTTTEHVRVYFSTGYPVGSHGLLAVMATLTAIPVEAAYNPFIALLVALATLAFASLLRRSGLSSPVAAATAFTATAANLVYHYALQGNVKEIAMLATLAAGVAVARELLEEPRPLGGVACLAVCAAAMLSVYSAAAVPYVGMLALLVLAGAFFVRRSTLRPRLIPAALLGAALAALLAIPALTEIVRFGDAASGVFASPQAQLELGHLLRPLLLVQSAGVWLGADYRVPVPSSGRELITGLLIGLVLLLALAGAGWALARREPGPLLYLVAAAVTLAVIAPRTSPYADGKMLALLSPGVVLLAGFGAAAVAHVWRPASYALAALVAAGVIWSDAYAYHDVTLAPIARMEAMEDVGERLSAERELVLVTEADEFAQYFMRDARINIATQAITPRQVQLRAPQAFGARWFDIDEYHPEYVWRFDTLVARRSPSQSRPPGDYRLTYRNSYYEVWRRRARPEVVEHLGAYTNNRATGVLPCEEVRALGRRAERDGTQLWVAARTEEPQLDPLVADRTATWPTNYVWPGNVTPATPGTVEGRVRVRGGRYRVWVRGSFGRDVEVFVDRRLVGAARGVNSPRQWHLLRELRLPRGSHSVRMVKGGGTLRPGDGFAGYLGPVAFEPLAPQPLATMEPSAAGDLCGRRVDWIERVRSLG